MSTQTIYIVTVGQYEDKRDVSAFRDEDAAKDEVAAYRRLNSQDGSWADYHELELNS
jgi:hypothetical protein